MVAGASWFAIPRFPVRHHAKSSGRTGLIAVSSQHITLAGEGSPASAFCVILRLDGKGMVMAEPTDAILPILQKIQDNISDMRKENVALRSKVDDVSDNVLSAVDKLEAFEGYMTYHMGLTMRHRADVEELQTQLAQAKERITTLEVKP